MARPFEDAAMFAQLGKTIKVMVPPPGPRRGQRHRRLAGLHGHRRADELRVLAGQVTVKDAVEQAAKNCEQIVAEAMR